MLHGTEGGGYLKAADLSGEEPSFLSPLHYPELGHDVQSSCSHLGTRSGPEDGSSPGK